METQHRITTRHVTKSLLAGSIALCGLALLIALLLVMRGDPPVVLADPIPVEQGGTPKFALSVKTVTPTLADTSGTTLHYVIEIRNTGAYTAEDTTLTDIIPSGTTYNTDVDANVPFNHTFSGDQLTWTGDVGFDFTAVVSFSVDVPALAGGTVINTAVISHPLIAEPVTVTAEAVVTDDPILVIEKTSAPAKPGANKAMTYTLTVVNRGQPTGPSYPITVSDQIPADTSVHDLGGGTQQGGAIEWTRNVTLGFGQSTVFTFSVDVGDVPSGTVITNDTYTVDSAAGVESGEPYTVTIIDPIFKLSKYVWPDPPGSNREMTYTLVLLNKGSLATDLVITDVVPAYVTYQYGGSESGGVVSWALPRLDTDESARFTYTVYISDLMDVPIVNDDYAVCSLGEGVCQPGKVLTSIVRGPSFVTKAVFDPIVKSPGGSYEVTPTLTVYNEGPGNALDAGVILVFERVKAHTNGMEILPPPAIPWADVALDCGEKCTYYAWTGDIDVGQTITFTTKEDTKGSRGVSTVGGTEGEIYTATVVVTDALTTIVDDNPEPIITEPMTGTTTGKVTHYASLVPIKSAPPVIGPGYLMTYTITVVNTAQSTVGTPVLTDTVPMSTTFVSASPGGVTLTISDTTIVSWTLEPFSTGEEKVYTFTVHIDDDLVSGTQIINRDYAVFGYDNIATGTITTGVPVTTTVAEVGLIDSYKEVDPMVVSPGPGNVLTFYLHIVNSSPLDLTGVKVYDYLPWESTTYQRDAIASAGSVYSDIVGVWWTGPVPAFSSQVVTLSVEVDPEFQGAITNTAAISHADLLTEVVVSAVAYVTDEPLLRISKSDSPDPVEGGGKLTYQIQVVNIGQQATDLVVTDTIPANTTYVDESATAGGQLVGDEVHWEFDVLEPGESRTFEFQVTVDGGEEIVNDRYVVRCAEGVVAVGAPVVTKVSSRGGDVYLPLVLRNASQ